MGETWLEQGGAAFPVTETGITNAPESEHGMSLRDWLAGQAIAGRASPELQWPSSDRYQMLAADAYAIADAMLKERKS